MKAYRSLTVRPQPPETLAPLEDLVRNLRWAWHRETQQLFAEIDPQLWEECGHDPLKLLGLVSRERLAELGNNPDFVARMHRLRHELTDYCQAPSWFDQQQTPLTAVAYFSMEFGIADVLPNFSGGLGVLAGDHLKSASDLGVPLIGVGLFYRFGYFAQTLSADGWQQEHYLAHDPHSLAMDLVRKADGSELTITIPMPEDHTLTARIWRVQVGRVPLLLLDADVPANSDSLRQTTDRLYGGDESHRIRQEILLGAGGVRAVAAYCAVTGTQLPNVFHMNEGHAGFSGLQRMSDYVTAAYSMPEALALVRAATIFTTHTPVPAGIDRFPRDLVQYYLDPDEAGFSRLLPGLPVEQIFALAAEDDPARFNMAHLGLRISQRANGVAKLHGSVSRAMFADLYPGFDREEVPIGSVTNGVHLDTWQDSAITPIAQQLAGSTSLTLAEQWQHTDRVDMRQLWEVRAKLRGKLLELARQVVRDDYLQRGTSPAELGWVDSIFDPHALTIGFARRVSTYKRLTLMLQDKARLRALLLDSDRPIQLLIAGKAHPADEGGKRLLQEMAEFANDPELRHRIAILPNYSMSMAAVLCAGADVWLNNPIRPQEASGTSGMKVALNGGLNLSISDGWWDELYDGYDGWVIPSSGINDPLRRDHIEAAALYDLLEQQVVPAFYDQDESGFSLRWAEQVRHSLSFLGPQVQATRMVRDYVTDYYGPAAVSADSIGATRDAVSDFIAWQERVRNTWPAVRILGVDVEGIGQQPALGHDITVRVPVNLSGLQVSDIAVEVIVGRLGSHDELQDIVIYQAVGDDTGTFSAQFTLDRAGQLGYTVRIVPAHHLLAAPAEMGLITLP